MSLRRILPTSLPIFWLRCLFAVLTSQSWCLLIEWFDLAELDLEMYKKISARESWLKTLEMKLILALKLVCKLPSPLRWHLWLLRDFWEYLSALLHKFNPVFSSHFHRFPTFGVFEKAADSDCVYRVSNGQSGAAFVCSKYSLIKLDLGILNPANQQRKQRRVSTWMSWSLNWILFLNKRTQSLSVCDGNNGSHAINLFIDCL